MQDTASTLFCGRAWHRSHALPLFCGPVSRGRDFPRGLLRPDAPVDYEGWLRRYLAGGSRIGGMSLLLFALVCFFVIVLPLYREEPENAGLTRFFFGVDLAFLLAGGAGLLSSFLPSLLPNYRRIRSWGDPGHIAALMYRELTGLPPLGKADVGLITEHFLVVHMPVRRIFYRPLLEECRLSPGMGVYVLRFRDGGRCRLNHCCQALLQPLLKNFSEE